MITEDRVPFEIAKLLKDKGFPQEYDMYHSFVYNEEDYEDEYEVDRMVTQTQLVKVGTLSSYPVGIPDPKCYCPTIQMVLKWLRNVHKIHIYATYNEDKGFQPKIISLETGDNYITETFNGYTFEAVILYAIEYTLENLI